MADPFEEFREELETALADIEILKRGQLPPGTDVGALPMIEAWAYSHHLAAVPYLTGITWGFPEVPDGRTVSVNPILWFDERRGLARSTSSLFRLGRSMSEILRELVQRDSRHDNTPLSKVQLDQIGPGRVHVN